MKNLTIGYGMTETSPAITCSNVHDPIEKRAQTVGKALPATEVKIIDPATK